MSKTTGLRFYILLSFILTLSQMFKPRENREKYIIYSRTSVFHFVNCQRHHIPFTPSHEKGLSAVLQTTCDTHFTVIHSLHLFLNLTKLTVLRVYHVVGISCGTVCPHIDPLASSCFTVCSRGNTKLYIRQ